MKKTSKQPKGTGISTQGANNTVAQNQASAGRNITKQSMKK